MARRCVCCQHPKLNEINAALLGPGGTIRSVAKRFKVSEASAHRHRTRHIQAAQRNEAIEVVQANRQTMLELWDSLKGRFDRIANDAKKQRDHRGETAALREQIRLMDLGLKAEQLKRDAANTHAAQLQDHPDWPAMVGILLDTLHAHPDAYAAVREALTNLVTKGSAA